MLKNVGLVVLAVATVVFYQKVQKANAALKAANLPTV